MFFTFRSLIPFLMYCDSYDVLKGEQKSTTFWRRQKRNEDGIGGVWRLDGGETVKTRWLGIRVCVFFKFDDDNA